MKNTKKVLSVALAGALAFGSMGAAFAAAPEMGKDTDKKVIEAVERLSAFGIVDGMEDGKYHEEMKVTREQFAKILVTALGLSDAADAAKGSTKFSDVEASRWSAGYINVAAGQGVLNGYPDGTFQPSKEVSYAEAVTMLVRALGYKDEFLPGSWPGNYVAKAADTGITSGASFADANGTSDRGTVAVLVDNALDSKVIKVQEYVGGTTKYSESNQTLLKNKLDVNKHENVRVLADKAIDDSLNKNEVKVKFLKDMDKDEEVNVKNAYDEGRTEELDLAKDINLRTILGEEATIYLNDDNEIIYAQNENDDKANFDSINEAIQDGSKIEKLDLVKFDDEYKFADDAVVYVFDEDDNKYRLEEVKDNELKDVKAEAIAGHVGKFVVKNNEIVYAEIKGENEAEPWMFVKENKGGVLKGICSDDTDFELDLTKDGDYDGALAFDQDGNKLEAKDIKENSIIYVQKQKYDGDDYAVVTVLNENKVKGKLGKVKEDKVEIGDKEYKVAEYTEDGKTQYSAFYSVDKNDHSDKWDPSAKDWEDDMEDADEAEMVAYLDATGKIVYLTSEVKETSDYRYGIVTKAYADGDKIKVYTVNKDGDKVKGEEVSYTLEEDDNFKTPMQLDKYGNEVSERSEAIDEGDVVKFKINKDGKIAEDELYVMDKDNAFEAKGDFGKDTIKTASGKAFSVDSRTVLLNAEGYEAGDSSVDTDDFGIIKWADIKDDNSDNAKFFVFTDDDNDVNAEAVVFIGENGLTSASDEEAIYVIEKWTKSGDTYVKYINEDGKEFEKEVDKGYDEKEDAYIAKVKSDGKIELITNKAGDELEGYEIVDGKVIDKDGKTITVKDTNGKTTEVTLKNDTVVYEEDNKKTISKIKEDDAISFIVKDGVSVRVVERLVDDEEEDVLDKVESADKEEVKLASLSDVTVKEGKNSEKLSVTVEPTNADIEVIVNDEKIVKYNKEKMTFEGLKVGETTVTVKATKSGHKSDEETFKVIVTKEDVSENVEWVEEPSYMLGYMEGKVDTTKVDSVKIFEGDKEVKTAVIEADGSFSVKLSNLKTYDVKAYKDGKEVTKAESILAI